MSRSQTIIFIISIIAVIAGLTLLLVPRFLTPAETKAPAPASNSVTVPSAGSSATADVGKVGPGEKIIVLSKLGMTCSSCEATVGGLIAKVDGVVKYSVSAKKDQATVRYSADRTDANTIKQAIIDGGYKVGDVRERQD